MNFNYSINLRQHPIKRVRCVTFARGMSVPPYFTTETLYDTYSEKLSLKHWVPILLQYITDGVKEIIVSGNSCGRFLRRTIKHYFSFTVPILIMGDMDTFDVMIGRAEKYLPQCMICRCMRNNLECIKCTEKKAIVTVLYLQDRI